MIDALSYIQKDRLNINAVSRQKKDALFEQACYIALIARDARDTDGASLITNAKGERKKFLLLGLELLIQQVPEEEFFKAFTIESNFWDVDARERIEIHMIISAMRGIIRKEHAFTILCRMSALLGFEYYDKSIAWMNEQNKNRRSRQLNLIVPGDFPDIINSLSSDLRMFEQVIRSVGRTVAVGAFAGCAREYVDIAKKCFNPIGSIIFEDDVFYAQNTLSTDEIVNAQNKFIDIVSRFESAGRLALEIDKGQVNVEGLVQELTSAMLAIDDKVLKRVLRNFNERILAMAMQSMEPHAHERVLSFLPTRQVRKVLNALDAMILLPHKELTTAVKQLAQAICDEAATQKLKPSLALNIFTSLANLQV